MCFVRAGGGGGAGGFVAELVVGPARGGTVLAGQVGGVVVGVRRAAGQMFLGSSWLVRLSVRVRILAAIVGRFAFDATIIEIDTDSYRLAPTRARAEQAATI
jgi:hypothetical protein